MIPRSIEDELRTKLGSSKAIVILGARQIGKTTVVEELLSGNSAVLWLNADLEKNRQLFEMDNLDNFGKLLDGYHFMFVDEAQRIENVGLKLKYIHDKFKHTAQIIATGSSSFDLANEINEPMTGRKWEYQMYPFSFAELANFHGLEVEKSLLKRRLLYGTYPDVVTDPNNAEEILRGISNANMYKDVLKWSNLYKTDKIEDLTKALAYQIGSQVSFREIGNLLSLDHKTVEKYINLLEQAFVIFRVGSYSRNLRNELKASNKYYFYDVGVRNAVIDDFNPLKARRDIGSLFENYMIAELVKKSGKIGYFWRNRDGGEVDYVVEKNRKVSAYEFKWSPKRSGRMPKQFIEAYTPEVMKIVNSDNYYNILL
jgi:predicted AAA+ superfamily ATPase